MNEWLLKKLKIGFWPPILYPVVFILFIICAPIYYSIPVVKWLIGRWKCNCCGNEYGIKDKKHIQWLGYDTFVYKCDACKIAEELTEK